MTVTNPSPATLPSSAPKSPALETAASTLGAAAGWAAPPGVDRAPVTLRALTRRSHLAQVAIVIAVFSYGSWTCLHRMAVAPIICLGLVVMLAAVLGLGELARAMNNVVADDSGLTVSRWRSEQHIPWGSIARVAVVPNTRSSSRIRVVTTAGATHDAVTSAWNVRSAAQRLVDRAPVGFEIPVFTRRWGLGRL